MSKLRSVNTHFWSDNYVIDLDPTEKLLFLYLLTNENTNMLGVYELHLRKIAFETGIDKNMVEKIFDRFSKDDKASYVDGYVCLHNFTKHQSYNTNMKKSAITSFNELPLEVRKQPFIKPLLKPLKPLPKGSEPIAEYELERELEEEKESEVDTADSGTSNIPSLDEVKEYFKENGYSPKVAEKAYNIYNASVEDHPKRQYWRDSRDNMIKNWKLKMQSVWFTEENKIKQNGKSQFRPDAIHL